MKGYKVFEKDWKCKGFQYEVGKTFKHNGEIKPCESGFHFCKNLVDCFNYYEFNPNNKVAEIEAIGNIETDDDEKFATDEIKIIRELNWHEVLDLCNTGCWNSGRGNSGNYNTGNFNSGYRNSGRFNSGSRNSGNNNSGDYNTGFWNSGNRNTGDQNSGKYNSGDQNTGNRNSGHVNLGDYNSGYCNFGDFNSGDCNTGKFNSGGCNVGDFNSGYFNSIDYEIGIFNNTPVKTIRAFNKEIPFDKMNEINKNDGFIKFKMNFKLGIWVEYDYMTDDEKKEYPAAENLGGYLKQYTYEEACKNSWDEMIDEEKSEFQKLPNFDPVIFKEITGIDIDE